VLQRILSNLQSEGVSPSFSCIVVKNNKQVFCKNFNSCNNSTVYDIASLTKPLLTFPLVKQSLSLNFMTDDFFDTPPINVSIEKLITHTSGLIPWLPLYHYKKSYRDTIFENGISEHKNTTKVYSCLNYILLKIILEKYAKMTFKIICNAFLTNFQGNYINPPKKTNIKPTEFGNRFELNLSKQFITKPNTSLYRLNKLICGEVHDLNAYYDNGISGNSGLFANTNGVIELLKHLIEFNDFNLPLFETDLYYYHMGFTGTGFAVTKNRKTAVVFLSNRISPDVKKVDFSKIRHEIFTAAINKYDF